MTGPEFFTALLNKTCCDTGKTVKPGDMVVLRHAVNDSVFSHGWFEWSPDERKFNFRIDTNTNSQKNIKLHWDEDGGVFVSGEFETPEREIWNFKVSLNSELN